MGRQPVALAVGEPQDIDRDRTDGLSIAVLTGVGEPLVQVRDGRSIFRKPGEESDVGHRAASVDSGASVGGGSVEVGVAVDSEVGLGSGLAVAVGSSIAVGRAALATGATVGVTPADGDGTTPSSAAVGARSHAATSQPRTATMAKPPMMAIRRRVMVRSVGGAGGSARYGGRGHPGSVPAQRSRKTASAIGRRQWVLLIA